MKWEQGVNDREFLVYARQHVVGGIAAAQERGGCRQALFEHRTGKVCAIGSLIAYKLRLKGLAVPSDRETTEASRALQQVWEALSVELFGSLLWQLNDRMIGSANPPVEVLTKFLAKIDEKLACYAPLENHEVAA